MFTGIYQHNLDAKGRIIMPTKLRDELGQSFYVSRGVSKAENGKICLQVYPIDKWEAFLNLINEKLSFTKAQNFKRILCSGASYITLNEQGRFSIPQNLREFADIEKEVVVVGAADIVEIWSLNNWQQFEESQSVSDEFSQLTELI